MGIDLDEVRNHYVDLYGEDVRSASRLQELHDHYGRRSEASLLDAIAATAALDALFLSDQVDLGHVTPQMRRAFALAFPNKSLSDLNDLSPESAKGWLGAWKGKFFEVVVEDKLNAGEQVGDVRLGLGQIARLANSPTQPGFNLEIVNSDGNIAEQLQLKATESLGYVKEALEKYPGMRILATEEAASDQIDAIISSGVRMGAGALAAFAGAGILSIPVAFLTRLGVDRHQIGSGLVRKLRSDRAQLEPLLARPAP